MTRGKRAAALLLCGLLLCELCSCAGGTRLRGDAPKKFEDTDAIQSYAEGIWVNEENTKTNGASHYRMILLGDDLLYRWDFTLRSGQSLEDMMTAVLQNYEAELGSPARSLMQLLLSGWSTSGMEITYGTPLYDAGAGQVLTLSGKLFGTFCKDGTLLSEGVRYHAEETTQTLSTAFVGAVANRFERSYSNLLTYQDVRYDATRSLGRYFLLTGTAELDDYYNYEYDNLESVYFCVCVTPSEGGRWYIYGSRYQHEDLFEQLKRGPAAVMLLCRGDFRNALENEMAGLVDYCWN